VVEAANVVQLLVLAHPGPPQGGTLLDKKKTLLLVCLKEAIRHGKSATSTIAVTVDNTAKLDVAGPTAPLPETLAGSACSVVMKALGAVLAKEWLHPSPKYFLSSAGDACIKAYIKANEGLLFLLPSGIVWTKPLTFIPAAEIEDVEFNTGAAKTIDLVVSCPDASAKTGYKNWEFAMIQASEQAHIAKYFRKMTKKGHIEQKEYSDDEEEEETENNAEQPATTAAEGAAKETAPEDDDDMSSDDDEYDPDKTDDEAAEEEDDDDDDNEGGNASDSDEPSPSKKAKFK